MEIAALFLIGFLGSLHCIGMCGPIVLAIPVAEKYDILKRLLYNFGRIITYTVLGLAAGFAGSRFFAAGFQQYSSIIFGAVIILYVILPASVKAKAGTSKTALFLLNPVKKWMGRLFKYRSSPSYLFIGILNGFLPCGFVYMAMAASAASGSVLKGAVGMALFGLGTTPSLFFFSFISRYLNQKLKFRINRIIPVLAILLGILFVLRGLNLGIPFISPRI